MNENDHVEVKLYPDKGIEEISGPQNFVVDQLEKNKKDKRDTNQKESNSKKILKFLNRWGPERFPRLIYGKVTEIRGLIFYILLLLFLISLPAGYFYKDFSALNLDEVIFKSWSEKMANLIFTIGAFTAGLFTILIETIKDKRSSENVKAIWNNLVKYTIYSFTSAFCILGILFLRDLKINIPALSSFFVLFLFLTLNSFYTTIRMMEILVNENFTGE